MQNSATFYKFPSLTPESLAAELEQAFVTFDELLEKLNTNVQDLLSVMTSPEFHDMLHARALLTYFNIKFLSHRYAGVCFARTVGLTESDKPEVARRAAQMVLHHADCDPEKPPSIHRRKLSDPQALAMTLQRYPYTDAQAATFESIGDPLVNPIAYRALTIQQRTMYEALRHGNPIPSNINELRMNKGDSPPPPKNAA